MRILYINNDGAGFADHIEVEDGTTVARLFQQRVNGAAAKPVAQQLHNELFRCQAQINTSLELGSVQRGVPGSGAYSFEFVSRGSGANGQRDQVAARIASQRITIKSDFPAPFTVFFLSDTSVHTFLAVAGSVRHVGVKRCCPA